VDTNLFFGHFIDPYSLGGKSLVLLLAALCGGLIGLQREWSGNAAGMRTHILVCIGSTTITLASVEIGLGVQGGLRGDPGHIAAQIVSGIGFLGAGAILREGLTVRGLTTAASIWATAGIGIALGASPHLGELGVLSAAIVLCTLTVLERLEDALKLKQAIHILNVEVQEKERGPARVLDLLSSQGFIVVGVQSQAGQESLNKDIPGVTRQMRLRVQLPRNFDRNDLNARLMAETGVVSFHLE